jgi:phospholipase C
MSRNKVLLWGIASFSAWHLLAASFCGAQTGHAVKPEPAAIAPPQKDAFGFGPRVPALVISPYARPGYIDPDIYEFSSILKFIETRWRLPHLTARDDQASAMLQAFDFNQKPLAPDVIPVPALSSPTAGKYRYCSYPSSVPIAGVSQ